MILMVSGRTDIVAFYSKWFINRYKEGFVMVRNPFNPKLVSKISFDDVDGIVFCTKNPIPIIPYLKEIEKPIIFHVTLTPYKKNIEPNVEDKTKIIDAIKELSSITGIDNLYVRYDPILINSEYTLDYHIKAFNKMCILLNGYVKQIIISFIDNYKNVRKNMRFLNYKEPTEDDYKAIGLNFARIARENNMTVQTCFEEHNLTEFGFIKRDCITQEIAFKLTGKTRFKKQTQRKGGKCNCVEMVDIGAYNSCKHMCKYCYANYDEKMVNKNCQAHDYDSPLLIGNLQSDDIIKDRKV